MFGSSIIDIAIGITFVFLLLSVIASALNEIILSFLNMRGRELLRGLKTLLDDDEATGLVNKLYNHGQIFGLFQGEFDPKKTGNLPSYIPPRNFMMALLDIVPPPAEDSAAVQQGAASKLASLRESAQKLAQDSKTEKVGKPLVSMIDTAGSDAEKLRKSIEDWYNSAMDRVSGWYKYRTQWILFAVGLILAISLNADTVRIVKQLSKDSTLRQSIIAAAQSTKERDNKGGQPIQDQIKQAHDQVSQIESLGIPLGWTGAWRPCSEPCKDSSKPCTPPPCSTPEWIWGWLRISGGWILTAVAVSLGAPFWFDMLNKIMVVRSTVKPREKSQEEESKDKEKK
jgi:hypothetical protein